MTPQLDIDFARAARDEGMQRAEDRANDVVVGWSELAFKYVQLFATQRKGKRFIGREIVLAAKSYGLLEPSNDKAWGSPIQKAVRLGILRKVGYAPDPNRHMSPVPLFEAV